MNTFFQPHWLLALLSAIAVAPAFAVTPPASVTTPSTIIVRASGSMLNNVGPKFQLRVNNVVQGDVEVKSSTPQDYSFTLNSRMPAGAKVEVVFYNDDYANGQDRNLYVDSIGINGYLIPSTAPGVVFDRGSGAQAFDNLDVIRGRRDLLWNGALRFRSRATAPAPPPKADPVPPTPAPTCTVLPKLTTINACPTGFSGSFTVTTTFNADPLVCRYNAPTSDQATACTPVPPPAPVCVAKPTLTTDAACPTGFTGTYKITQTFNTDPKICAYNAASNNQSTACVPVPPPAPVCVTKPTITTNQACPTGFTGNFTTTQTFNSDAKVCAYNPPTNNQPTACTPVPVVPPVTPPTTPGLTSAEDRHSEWSWNAVSIGAGGWMRGMVFHPNNANIRYARSDTWGAFRWDATTQNWQQIVTPTSIPASVQVASSVDANKKYGLTSTPNGGGVDSIAIDPNDQNKMLFAMSVSPPSDLTNNIQSTGNVYYSLDGGRTFAASTGLYLPSYTNTNCPGQELEPNNSQGERLRVDPNNSKVVYLGSRFNGLWMSSDGGVSFSKVTAGNAPSADCQETFNILFDKRETSSRNLGGSTMAVSKTIYITINANNGAGVWQSTDGGANWSLISQSRGEISKDNIGGSTLDRDGNFWITPNGSALKFAPSTSTWTRYQPPRTGSWIAVDPADPNRIFTSNFALSVSRSNDGGQTWKDLGDLDIRSNDGIDWISAHRKPTGSHGSFFFDPSVSTAGGKGRLWASQGNAGVIFADLDDATQQNYTNGPTWKEQARGIEQLVGANIIAPPGNNGGFVAAALDETLFYVSNPKTFNALRFDIDTSLKGNVNLSSAGMVAYSPDTPAVMVNNSANLYSAYFRGGPFKNNFASYSTNYGRNWSLFSSIVLTDNDNSYGGGSISNRPEELVGGMIAISARGDVLPGKGQAIWTGRDNLVWLPFAQQYGPFGPAAPAYYSLDGGASWQKSTIYDGNGNVMAGVKWIFVQSSKAYGLVADPVTPLKFYAWSTFDGYFVTEDGGRTWRQTANGGLNPWPNYFFINQQLVAVPGRAGDLWFSTGNGAPGAAGFLYHSSNGGNTWTNIAVDRAYNVAVGKGAPGKAYALYIYGRPKATYPWGVYRSDDTGVTWALVSGDGVTGYPFNSFNLPSNLAASQDTEGLIYISFTGMSYIWGYQKSVGNPYQ
jgi:hypothetical protein